MRLIDADAIKYTARFTDYADGRMTSDAVITKCEIDSMPTIDPVRHGRWITSNCVISYGTKSQTRVYTGCKCSVCGGVFGRMSDLFCYHCGAKMDGDEE